MNSQLLLKFIVVLCLVCSSGCSFTSVVKENEIQWDGQHLKIDVISWSDPSPYAIKISKTVRKDYQTHNNQNQFTKEETRKYFKVAKDISDSFKKFLPLKIIGPDFRIGNAKDPRVVLQLEPTLVYKIIGGGKRIEIKASALNNGVIVWLSTIAAFGTYSVENEVFVDNFIDKLRKELSTNSIVL